MPSPSESILHTLGDVTQFYDMLLLYLFLIQVGYLCNHMGCMLNTVCLKEPVVFTSLRYDIIAEWYQVCSPWPWCYNVQLFSYCTMYHCSLAGTWYTTYTRVPYYITSYQRSLVLESLEYTVIDMRIQDTVTIELSSNIMAGRIITGELYMH